MMVTIDTESCQRLSLVAATESHLRDGPLKRQGMLHFVELLQEVNALITRKIAAGLGMGQSKVPGEITDNSHDI